VTYFWGKICCLKTVNKKLIYFLKNDDNKTLSSFMTYFNISSFERIVIPVATKSINIPRIFPCPDVKNNVKLFKDFDNTISGLIEIPITPDMISGDSMTSVRNGITINLPNNLVAGTYFVRVEFYSDMSYPLQKTAFDTTYYYESQFALVFTMLKRLEFLLEHTILIDNIDFVQKPLDWESNAILKWNKTQKLIENLSFTDKEEEILAGDQWVVARDEKGFVVSAVKVNDLISVLTFLDSGDVGNVLFKTKNKDGDKIAECEFAPFKVENITDLDISEKRNDSRMSWIDGEYLMKKHDTTLFFPKKLDVTKPLYDKDSYDLRKEAYYYRLQSWYKEYRIICVKNNRENLNFVKTDIFIFNVGDIPEDCVSTFDISLIDLGVESNILLKDAFSIVFLKGIDFSVPLFTTAGLFESEDASLIINLKVVFNSVGVLQVVQYGSGAGGDGGRPIREKVITFPSQINNELPIFDLNNYPVKVASYNFSLSQEYFSNYNIFCVDNSNPATADDVTLTTINITNVNYIPFDAYSTFDITIIGLDGNTFLNRSFVINFYFFEISAFGIAFQFKPSDSNLGSNPICYSLVFSKNEIIKINDNSINSVNGSAVRNSLDVENPLMNILSVVNPVNKKTLLRYNFDEIIGQNYVTFPGQIDKTKPIEDFSNYNPRFNEFVFSLLNIKHLEMSFICINNNGVGGAGGELLTDINIFNVNSIPSGKVFVCNFVIYQGNNLTTELGKAFTFNFYAGVDKTSALLYTTDGEEYHNENGKISLRVCLHKYGAIELIKYGSGGGGGGGGNFVTQTQFNQAVAQINETIIESADATLLSANDYTDEQIALIGGKEIWVNPIMPVTIWGSDNNAVKYVVSKELAIWVGIYTTVGLTNRTMIYKIDTRPMATWNDGDFYHLRLYVEVKRGDFFGALGGKFRVVDENNTVIVGDVDVIDRTDGGIAGVNGLILFSRVNGVSVIRPLPFSTFVNHSDPLIVDLAGYLTKDDAELLYAKITNVYSRVEADATFLNQLEFTGQGILDRLDTTNPVMNILGAVNPVNGQLVLQYNGNEIIGQNYVTFPGQIDNTKPIGDFTNYSPRFNEFTFSLLNLMYLEMSFVCVNNNGIGGAGIKTVTNVNFFNSGTIPSGKVFVGNIIIYQGNDTTTPLVEAFTFNFYAGVDATSALLFTTFGEVYQIVDGQISFRISVNKYGLVELDKYGLGGGGGVVDAPTIVNLSVENPQKNARLKLNDDGSKFFVEVDGGGGGGSVIPSEIVDNATVLTENQKYYDWAFDSVSANLTWMDKKTFTPAEASLIMADYPRPVYALQDGKNLELKNLEFYALRNFEGSYYSGRYYTNSAYYRRFGIILDVTGLTNKFVSVTWRNLLIGTGGGYYNGTLFPLATSTTYNYDMYKMDNSVTNAWYIWFNNNQSDNNIMFLSWENSSGYDSSDKLIVQVEDNKLFVNQNGWYYGSGAIQNIIPASRNYIGRADILVRSEFDKNIVCISKITILDKNGNWGSVGGTSSDVYLSGDGLVGEIECVLRVMCGGYGGVYYIFFNGSNVKTFKHPFINNIGIYDFPVRVSATKITFLTEPSFETILIQNIITEVTNINNTIQQNTGVVISSKAKCYIPSMLGDFDIGSFPIYSDEINKLMINLGDDDLKCKDINIVLDFVEYSKNNVLTKEAIDFKWGNKSGLGFINFNIINTNQIPFTEYDIKFSILPSEFFEYYDTDYGVACDVNGQNCYLLGNNTFLPGDIARSFKELTIELNGSTYSITIPTFTKDLNGYWEFTVRLDLLSGFSLLSTNSAIDENSTITIYGNQEFLYPRLFTYNGLPVPPASDFLITYSSVFDGIFDKTIFVNLPFKCKYKILCDQVYTIGVNGNIVFDGIYVFSRYEPFDRVRIVFTLNGEDINSYLFPYRIDFQMRFHYRFLSCNLIDSINSRYVQTFDYIFWSGIEQYYSNNGVFTGYIKLEGGLIETQDSILGFQELQRKALLWSIMLGNTVHSFSWNGLFRKKAFFELPAVCSPLSNLSIIFGEVRVKLNKFYEDGLGVFLGLVDWYRFVTTYNGVQTTPLQMFNGVKYKNKYWISPSGTNLWGEDISYSGEEAYPFEYPVGKCVYVLLESDCVGYTFVLQTQGFVFDNANGISDECFVIFTVSNYATVNHRPFPSGESIFVYEDIQDGEEDPAVLLGRRRKYVITWDGVSAPEDLVICYSASTGRILWDNYSKKQIKILEDKVLDLQNQIDQIFKVVKFN